MNNDKENIARTVGRNSFYTFIYHGWYLGSRLVLTPLILTYITIEEYGLWSYCFVILSCVGFVGFGASNTYLKYAAEFRARGEDEKINELLSTGTFFMLAICSLIVPFIYMTGPALINILGIDQEYDDLALLLFFGAGFIFLTNFCMAGYQGILEGEQRIDLVRKIQIVASVVEIILIILLFRLGYGVISLLIAYSVRFVLIILANIYFAHQVFPFLKLDIKSFSRNMLDKFIQFGGRCQGLAILFLLYGSLDRIFITRMLNLEATGIYEAGRKIPLMGLALPSAVAGTFIPAAAHLEGSSQGNCMSDVYLKGTRYLMIGSSVCYIFLFLMAEQIMHVWIGKEFQVAIPIMQILSLGILTNLVTGIGTSCLRGIGDLNYEIKYMIISLALFLAFVFPFTHIKGLIGIAWAYSLSQIAGSLYFIVKANRLFNIPGKIFFKNVFLPMIWIAVAGIPIYILVGSFDSVFDGGRWAGLGLLIIAFLFYGLLVIFGFLILRKWLLAEKEIQMLSNGTSSLFEKIRKMQWKPA